MAGFAFDLGRAKLIFSLSGPLPDDLIITALSFELMSFADMSTALHSHLLSLQRRRQN